MKLLKLIILFLTMATSWAFSQEAKMNLSEHIYPFNINDFGGFNKFKLSNNSKIPVKNSTSNPSISLEMIDGRKVKFNLSENKISENPLNNILTFDGVSEDGTESLKLSFFDKKINAIVKTKSGYYFIEPHNSKKDYYRTYSAFSDLGTHFSCGTKDNHHILSEIKNVANSLVTTASTTNFPYGNQLRKFRMAVATTGEFTAAFQGDKDKALVEVVNMVNLINKIYESEVSITFTLIEETTNKSLIFTDANTDPFTVDPNFANAENSQAGFKILNDKGILAYAKYDIGHTFNILSSATAQGQAGPQPCNNELKARAWSQWGLSMPKASVANLIVHEMGHQFSALHTYNATGGSIGSPDFCTFGWSETTAVEPGSGTTIMSYGNNCTIPNRQVNDGENSLDYFNAKSLDQILSNIKADASCFTTVNTDNIAPSANAGVDITIPKNTPFMLKGIGSDANDTRLSYTWEQADVATVKDKGAFGSTIVGEGGYTAVNSTTAPLFRSEQSMTPERFFPKMEYVLNNKNQPPVRAGEALPAVARTLKFRFTVRDNNLTSGGVDSDEMIVTVSDAGPLALTYPNTDTNIDSNHNTTITWNVNKTNTITQNVNILLSIDGGITYPYVLATNTPNDGTESVLIPNIPSSNQARIKIVGVINDYAEFFDVSDVNFTISSANCIANLSYIEPTTAVTTTANSVGADLKMLIPSAATAEFTSKTIPHNTTATNSGIVVYSDSAHTSALMLSDSFPSITFKFRVTKTGEYTFHHYSGFPFIMSVHSASPYSIDNFITSNTYKIDEHRYSLGYETSKAILTAGVDYYFVCADYFHKNTSTPQQDYVFKFVGPGSLYELKDTPIGYDYTFVAIDNVTGKVVAQSNTADFTSINKAGTYTIKGVSYNSISNPVMFVGKTLAQVTTEGVCLMQSNNSRELTITTATLGINTNVKKELSYWPNPVNDILNINSNKNITNYQIFDMSGKQIANEKFRNPIPVDKLSKGIYIIRLIGEKQTIETIKIIKK